MNVRIDIGPDDIQTGLPGIANRCPVALAVRRLLAPDWEPRISHNTGLVCRKDSILAVPTTGWFILPETAVDFIRRFDGKNPVEPFSFWTDLPEESLRARQEHQPQEEPELCGVA